MRPKAVAVAALATVMLLGGCRASPEPRGDGSVAGTSRAAVSTLQAQAALRPCPESADTATGRLRTLTLPCLGGGGPVRLAAPGRPMVLNLWASWCGPCATELPRFAAVDREIGDRVLFMGVDTADREAAGLGTLIDAGVHFPSVSDPQRKVQTELGVSGLPATVFMRADGSIAHTMLGAIADPAELRGLIREHLGVA